MAKRFVDTARFFDPWYRSLPPTLKVFWEFIISSCDLAGAWKKDYDLAKFILGEGAPELDPADALLKLNAGKERIIEFGDYWFVVDFIPFQYGTLSADCRPHRAVVTCLEAHVNRGLPKKYVKAAKLNEMDERGVKRWNPPPGGFKRLMKKIDKGAAR